MRAALIQLALWGGLGMGGDPAAGRQPPAREPALGETRQCAELVFRITGTRASFSYPSQPCAMGPASIRFDRMIWDGSRRVLTIQVRALNSAKEAVPLPVRLQLPASGRVVLAPPGTAGDSIAPLNADSTLAGDRRLWLIGGTGTLAPGDSSATRDLTFMIGSSVTKGRLRFDAEARPGARGSDRRGTR